MRRVQLIHWNADEAEERADRLKAAGYEVNYQMPDEPAYLSELRENPGNEMKDSLGSLARNSLALALPTFRQPAMQCWLR